MFRSINKNVLTDEQIDKLNSKPNDFNISEEETLRSICTHFNKNHESVVYMLNDGSGRCSCPICGAIWDATDMTKKEVEIICDKMINILQNIKWAGDLDPEFVKKYFTIIPIINKLPDLYEHMLLQLVNNSEPIYCSNKLLNDRFNNANAYNKQEYQSDNKLLNDRFNHPNNQYSQSEFYNNSTSDIYLHNFDLVLKQRYGINITKKELINDLINDGYFYSNFYPFPTDKSLNLGLVVIKPYSNDVIISITDKGIEYFAKYFKEKYDSIKIENQNED